jgi:hypothetical protein
MLTHPDKWFYEMARANTGISKVKQVSFLGF